MEAVLKLLFLNLLRIEKKWTMPITNWSEALNYLMVCHHERVSPYLSHSRLHKNREALDSPPASCSA